MTGVYRGVTPTQLRLPLASWLADGTYLSVLIKPGLRETARAGLIEDAKAGLALDPERAYLVRVVEYTVPARDGKELICLITSITDPAAARADELAPAYHQRWEEETGNDQLKTHLRGPGAARTPAHSFCVSPWYATAPHSTYPASSPTPATR